MIGILEHIDGRKLTITDKEICHYVYLRKGVDSAQYLPLLQARVEVDTVEEKGFKMVTSLRAVDAKPVGLTTEQLLEWNANRKPVLPSTEVEKTKPVDMPASANIPKLKFGDEGNFTVVSPGLATKFAQTSFSKGDPKQRTITASWAMGAVLNSHALANANDAMALSTEQTMTRAKKLARELIDWVEEQAR